jgi:hypothetical protein
VGRQRNPFRGEQRGRKRPPAPAINELDRANSYTYSTAALHAAVRDCRAMELRGAGANGWAPCSSGWALRGWNLIGRR